MIRYSPSLGNTGCLQNTLLLKTEISALFSYQAALLEVVILEAPFQAVPDGISSRGMN